ncbi:MAG TPA: phosphatase PAP2 family protein [Blastocatellia bacterium]|nr:phosphatase PAP2 family protein [Blastocatellia bacterium]
MKKVVGITRSTSTPRQALLLSLLICALAQQPVWSQGVSAPPRDNARICGFFPCPQPDERIEPQAGQWKTWVLSSGSQLRVQSPPSRPISEEEIGALKRLSFGRDAAARDLINFWDAGSPSYRWNEFAIDRILRNNIGNPRAPRILSYVHVAIYDAMVSAWRWKYIHNRTRPSALNRSLTTAIPNPNSPSYPSEHAVAAGAASTVLAFFFPTDAEFFRTRAEEAGRSRLLAGVNYPSDVTAGLELGRAVAELVIERARTDGSDAVFSGTIPTGPCSWRGTNPLDPTAGNWRPWTLTSGSQFRPVPPPACDSSQMATELAEVKNFPRAIPAAGASFATTRLAFFWQGVGTVKLWNDVLSQKVFEYRLDNNPPRAARAYALVHVAYFDAAIACWDAKFTYWAIRPNQLDPSITTLFPNPNHPSYPAAHAALSGAQASMLAYLFPRDADYFKSLAKEAADSRLWAAVHYRSDLEVGLAQAEAVAGLVIKRARSDGSQ